MAQRARDELTFCQALALRVACVFVCCLCSLGLLEPAYAEDIVTSGEPNQFIVTGRVTDMSGQAIAGATVEWGGGDESFRRRIRVKTDKEGQYTLSLKSIAGEKWLAASARGYSPNMGDSILKPGKQVRDFVLERRPKKDHSVAGVIVDEHNKPIAGVRVEAFTPVVGYYSSFSSPSGRDYFPGPDRVAKTDEAGRFRITDLSTDKVQLNITSKHRWKGDENYDVEEGLTIMMSGTGEPGVVQGRVVDAQTKQPPKNIADVRVVSRFSTTNYQCALEDGTFRLPGEMTLGESYMVYVYAKGYAAASAHVAAVPADSKEFADIKLKARPALKGQLIDAETGQPVGKVPIVYGVADQMRYIEWSTLPKYADGYHFLTSVQHETSTLSGEFWFAEPEAGSRGVIMVLVDGYQRLLLFPRNRQLDETSGQLIVRLKRESAFEGVVRSEGKLLPNVSVSISGASADGVDQMYESVRTDAEGRYRYGRLAPGNYRLHAGQYSRAVKVGKGEAVTVNLGEDLDPIRIHGKAEPDQSISFVPQFRWDYTQLETKANPAGEYEIGGLKAGRYHVSMYSSNAKGYHSRQEQEIVVKNDGQQIDLLPKPIVKGTAKTKVPGETKN